MTQALTSDRFLAGGTESPARGVVVDLAVRLSLVVEIVPSRKRHSTHLTERERERGRGRERETHHNRSSLVSCVGKHWSGL